MNYYNEHDPYAARWLVNLIGAGHIAPGIVDQRSISDVRPNDLKGFTQCHFFAGIGIWSHALRRAGWADDRPVWTGSCPCQPFSAAGKGAGTDDERHLWPHWHHLIRECRPECILGEQVASKDGLGWLDLVSTDLEAEGYAFGSFDLCAAGFSVAEEGWQGDEWLQWAILSCPDPVVAEQLRDFAGWAGSNLGDGGDHLRQRLYLYAERLRQSDDTGPQSGRASSTSVGQGGAADAASGARGIMAHPDSSGREPCEGNTRICDEDIAATAAAVERGALCSTSGVALPHSRQCDGRTIAAAGHQRNGPNAGWAQGDGGIAGGGATGGLAYSDHEGKSGRGIQRPNESTSTGGVEPLERSSGFCSTGVLAHTVPAGRPESGNGSVAGSGGDTERVVNSDHPRSQGRRLHTERRDERVARSAGVGQRPDAGKRDWLLCNDPDGPRWRPVEPGTFPLADAAPARVGRLRAFGNGLDAETAIRFVEAVMECRPA